MSININGKSYNFSGNNVIVNNGKVFVDGKELDGGDDRKDVHITITGQVTNLGIQNCNKVEIDGDIGGAVRADGSLSCKSIGGDATSGGSMNCGHIKGNAKAGGSMNCGQVGGSASAGGSMNRS